MKPIRIYNSQWHVDFENMLSKLPITLEPVLLGEVAKGMIITTLVYNVYLPIYSINRNLS